MPPEYSFNTTEIRSQIMSKIKSTETKSEILLRKRLWSLGFRYRKNYNKLPGKPDIVFISKKIAIFIDGEFWHGYNWKVKKKRIKSNREYWIPKIEKNIKRDKANNKNLKQRGWIVLRYWEHQIKHDIQRCIDQIVDLLKN